MKIQCRFCFFYLIELEKMLPPLFPSQIHLQPEMKIPIMQAHQSQSHSQNQLMAHAQNHSPSQHHPQELHLNASPVQGPGNEQYISVASAHPAHLPHVSNLSRHINARYFRNLFSIIFIHLFVINSADLIK